jgi:peroxiredoxin
LLQPEDPRSLESLETLLREASPRPVLLAFFKTTCPTCKLTWPYLQKLHRAYGKQGVRVVGVSQDDAAASRAFFAEHGNASFDLRLDPEPRFPASRAFDVESVPHLALIAPDGTIQRSFEGWSRLAMEELGQAIAASAGLPEIPVVEPGDPVVSFKPG